MKIKTDNIKTVYELWGFYEYKRWTNEIDTVNVHIRTNEQGFKEIQSNPLQNFAACSAQQVLFINFFHIVKRESGTITANGKRKQLQFCGEIAPITAGVSRKKQHKTDFINITY